MKVGRRKRFVAVAFVAIAAGAFAAWQLGGLTGLVLVLLAVVLLGLAAIGFQIAQTERRLSNTLFAALSQALVGELRALTTRADQLSRQTDALTDEVEALRNRIERPGAEAERLLNAISAGYRRVEMAQQKHVKKTIAATNHARDAVIRRLAETFRQYEALTAIYMDTGSEVGFPPTRSWVASPDLLHFLYQQAATAGNDRILECGSGLSTVILAYGLRDKGSGRLTALEHLPKYAEQTRALLEQHDLSAWAEVRLAPLEDVVLEGSAWPWYQMTAVPDGDIDLLLVDGPPGHLNDQARYPALPLLHNRLRPGSLVILDDYFREAERQIAERWAAQFPELVMTEIKHEKGTVTFFKPSGPGSYVIESSR